MIYHTEEDRERERERESDVILWKTNINDRSRFIFRRIVCLYTSIYRLILFGIDTVKVGL